MEFLNDRYASLALTYDMNGKLFNRIPLIKKLKWREVFRFRALYGNLTDKNNPFKSNNPELFDFPQRDGSYTSYVKYLTWKPAWVFTTSLNCCISNTYAV
jgi:hypothetical protein